MQRFFVGTYTTPAPHAPSACGEGVLVCSLDTKSGEITPVNATFCDNPTYLCTNEERTLLFAASELDGGIARVSCFDVGDDKDLLRLLSVDSQEGRNGGSAVCNLCFHKGRVFATSYLDGKLDEYRVDDSANDRGKLTHQTMIQYSGSGPNNTRQEGAHAHQAVVSPEEKWLYVCDLGSDRVWRHALSGTKVGPEDGFTVIPPGYGPRHLVFHPTLPVVYVLCELTAHVLVCKFATSSGELEIMEDLATLPVDYTGDVGAAAVRVHPNGRALYFSNRFHDSVATFAIDPTSGSLSAGPTLKTGKIPRDINVDPSGQWLLVANQDGDSIMVFRVDPSSGLPAGSVPSSTFACKSPVNITF